MKGELEWAHAIQTWGRHLSIYNALLYAGTECDCGWLEWDHKSLDVLEADADMKAGGEYDGD